MLGCHTRIGDVTCQDRVLTIQEALVIQEVLEKDWADAVAFEANPSRIAKLLKIALLGMAVTAGFSAALQGKEMSKSDLGGYIVYRSRSRTNQERHVALALRGRFKGETGEKLHLVPLASLSASGITNAVWFDRVMNLYVAANIRNGPVFRVQKKDGLIHRAKISDLDPLFHDVLRIHKVQDLQTDLISYEADIAVELSIQRSLRRGSNTQARKKGFPQIL
jgi:hypothetical protein